MAKLIEKEFDVDKERSVDKRELLDPDRFGYLSLHYVVKLPAARLRLTEYKRFKDCCAEIQVRSILQHAWAEIEHDLGYKGKQAVPREIRRRFSRLAGLLEMADAEFVQIRNGLLEYEQTVSERIEETPASVLIDKASMHSFVKSSSIIHEIDGKIATAAKSRLVPVDVGFINRRVNQLLHLGFETIAEVDSSLRKFAEIIVRFVADWITPEKFETISTGICLFYLCYVVLASRKSVDAAYDYLEGHSIGDPSERKSIAAKMISVYNRVVAESG